MTETEFVVTERRLLETLSAVFAAASVAVDEKSSLVEDISELRDGFMNGAVQIFIKSPSFSKEGFVIKWLEAKSGLSRYIVDQFAGDGHLTMRMVPFPFSDQTIFRLSISYQSFFVRYDGSHAGPSNELKLFYKSLVRHASRETKNVEVWPRRFMRIQSGLQGDERSLLEAIKAPFRRST
ncbi:hypothetical protein ADU59_18940 [Pararhizobium polonicum]|uniref:Uncharacterized protein n=1 Tax=Pararhizobium polonicum TaxID=1612624 RepID=A0A1C7NXQ6_9HYPH|nr:hypothetical protein [Pararhizobium polonicum]OBZ93783.1 hypothetical protein ADU59_18940 [Pararhizobium polonicum]